MRSRLTAESPRVWLVEALGVADGVVFAGVEPFVFGGDRKIFFNKSAILDRRRGDQERFPASYTVRWRFPDSDRISVSLNAQYGLIRTLYFLKTVKWNSILSWDLEVVEGKKRFRQSPLPSMHS
jgi:hypothetical protein